MMTLQEIFDKVKTHLLTQNAKAQNTDSNIPPVCQYRASDGKKCAAGCLIKDEFYTPKLEGVSAHQGEVWDALVNSGVPNTPEAESLVSHLQICHDEEYVGDWPSQLAAIAAKHGLKH